VQKDEREKKRNERESSGPSGSCVVDDKEAPGGAGVQRTIWGRKTYVTKVLSERVSHNTWAADARDKFKIQGAGVEGSPRASTRVIDETTSAKKY